MKVSVTCPCCEGFGVIRNDPQHQDDSRFASYSPCRNCQGFGTILVSEEEGSDTP